MAPEVWEQFGEQYSKGKVDRYSVQFLVSAMDKYGELNQKKDQFAFYAFGKYLPVFTPEEQEKIAGLGQVSDFEQLQGHLGIVMAYQNRVDWLKKFELANADMFAPEGFELNPLSGSEFKQLQKMRPEDGAVWLKLHWKRVILLKEAADQGYIDAVDFRDFRKMEPAGAVLILRRLIEDERRKRERAKGLPA